MFSILSNFLQKKGLDCFAPIPLSACQITKPYLLQREGIENGTAVMIAVPYYTYACDKKERNLSAYAVSRDYHLFFRELFEEAVSLLKEKFPENRFCGFADHSPIAECQAASMAGLGVIGMNHLLITEKYSSYVFLGELITDIKIPCQIREPVYCKACGLCEKHCPMKECGVCLSALTQKKGALSNEETKIIKRYGSAWGCDICQAVCPNSVKAIQDGTVYSPIPYFLDGAIPHLSQVTLEQMTDTDFSERAYSWRGRNTIQRNLALLEEKEGDNICSD